jgi:hypothetical protein
LPLGAKAKPVRDGGGLAAIGHAELGQDPRNVDRGGLLADDSASATSRVLPTPASPTTSTAEGWPAAVRSMAARSRATSASRPTSTGQETRAAIPPIIPDPMRVETARGYGYCEAVA